MTYLREHPEETVLVHLTRAPTRATGVPLLALSPTYMASPRSSRRWPVVEVST